ncbi:DUF5688 family protein [Butyrivibrio sp. VCB2006]|uniref:DUF5688 family protein n=1 Tax=Butyrivibrio sp. VCB2006 TaxID=1280679 RepID=UPI000410B78A|nr:DUF5688 family protein [Butyrivibrio sp. VCB2006]
MDFDTFKEDLAKAVKDRLELIFDRKYSVETHTVEKMNQSYEALVVKPKDGVIGVNIGIDAAFKEYSDGRSFDMIVRQIASAAEHALDNHPAFDLEALTDYSQMKGKLAMEVVSAERNAELLETVPHKNMEDMAIVYRIVLDSSLEGRSSILVTNKMLDNYGITAEQLHADAMSIAPEVRPAVIQELSEVMAEMMGAEQAEMLGLGPKADEPIFVATVEDKTQGAGILAYQDFMDQAAEKLGGECLAIRWDCVDFENRIIHVNHTLSDRPDEFGDCSKRMLPTKTAAGTRDIPMVQEVYDAFLMEYEFQSVLGFCDEEIDGFTGFVFCTGEHKALHPGAVNRAILVQ